MLEKLSGPVLKGELNGQNGNNNVLRIKMSTKLGPVQYAAILLQERWEQGLTRLLFLLIHIPLGVLAGHLTGVWYLGVLATIGSWTFFAMFPPMVRWKEYRGHALEIAYEAAVTLHYDRNQREMEEADDMVNGYAGYFSKMTVGQVATKLSARRSWAQKVVANYRG